MYWEILHACHWWNILSTSTNCTTVWVIWRPPIWWISLNPGLGRRLWRLVSILETLLPSNVFTVYWHPRGRRIRWTCVASFTRMVRSYPPYPQICYWPRTISTCTHRWQLTGNYPVFSVVMVIYHHVERIWIIIITPNFLYDIYNHE